MCFVCLWLLQLCYVIPEQSLQVTNTALVGLRGGKGLLILVESFSVDTVLNHL